MCKERLLRCFCVMRKVATPFASLHVCVKNDRLRCFRVMCKVPTQLTKFAHVVVDHFYIALFSALEQPRGAHM